jgi:hypothetical protein
MHEPAGSEVVEEAKRRGHDCRPAGPQGHAFHRAQHADIARCS